MIEQTTNLDMGSKASGYMVMPVLEFLTGKPWCDMAKSFVSALRPSRVRICRKGCHCDAVNWRVTVWLNDDDIIKEITQEVGWNVYGELRESNGFPEFPYDTKDLRDFMNISELSDS